MFWCENWGGILKVSLQTTDHHWSVWNYSFRSGQWKIQQSLSTAGWDCSGVLLHSLLVVKKAAVVCTGRVTFQLTNCWIFCHLARDNVPLKTTTSSKVPGQKDNKQANVALAASQSADIQSTSSVFFLNTATMLQHSLKSSISSSYLRAIDRIMALPGETCTG